MIDDSEDIREVFRTWMEVEGYATVTAESGPQALELLSGGFEPGLVLLDLNMPRMSGVEFLREARARGFMTGVPVYVFSAQNSRPQIEGTEGWLKKPLDLNQLFAILETRRV